MNKKCIAGRSSRASATDDLDFYPTPPWATRALLERLPGDLSKQTVWEPACGRGDMVRVLKEKFRRVLATDIEPRGCGGRQDFLEIGSRRRDKIQGIKMICYKDQAFCIEFADGKCANHDCFRAFTNKRRRDAEEWWDGNGEPPVAFSRFHDCKEMVRE